MHVEVEAESEAFRAVLSDALDFPVPVRQAVLVDRPAVRTEPFDIAAEPSEWAVSRSFHICNM